MKALDRRLLAALRERQGGANEGAAGSWSRPAEAALRRELRRALGCSADELKASEQRLRWKGHIEFDRLRLAGSPAGAAPAEGAALPPVAATAPPGGAGGGAAPKKMQHPAASMAGGSGPYPETGSGGAAERRALPPTGEAHNRTGAAGLAHARRRSGRHRVGRSRAADARVVAKGAGADAQPLSETVRREAELSSARRRLAQSTGTVCSVLDAAAPASLAERIQTALAETPADLIKAVHRRHPPLWARAVALGRAMGMLPATALYDAIERGLTAMEAEGPHLLTAGTEVLR
jgi:hypothetical protein